MTFGLHPLVLAAAIGILLAIVAAVIFYFTRHIGTRIVMMILVLVFLFPAGYLFTALHPEWVDRRFRAYKAFYQEIQVGMTREQVLAAMERRYPKDGPRKRPKIMGDTPEALGFFMDPETSREPNCEGIFLQLESGRVTKKQYSAD